jgi:NADH:ubiquinone oxidoreductase subunit F (NADH-binding)
LPRLGAGPATGTADLAAHLAQWGPLPALPPGTLTAALVESGLRGRGGAGFPTGRKLAALRDQVASHPGAAPVVVGNGMEGEPASAKDAALLARTPHLVVDGMLAVAAEVGARRVVLAVKRGGSQAAAVRAALASRRAQDRLGVDLAEAPRPYVASQEKALVAWLSGRDAKPTVSPPYPVARGVRGQPTLVSNVETFAHIGLIARFGPAWFREVGSADAPGSRLVTLSGALDSRGVHEVPDGLTLAAVLELTGNGGRQGGSAVPVFLLGGYFGTWVSAAEADRVPGVRGAGVVVALPAQVCGLVETARIVRWLAAQSAGQCGPCRFGLPDLAGVLERLAAARAAPDEVATLHRWLADIRGRGACHHPDATVDLAASALAVFAGEVEVHLSGRCTAAGRAGVCPVPALERPRWR